MKQYLTPEQTAKLIELGFKKPKSIISAMAYMEDFVSEPCLDCERAYSIGELLSFLSPIIPQGYGYYINITHDSVSWVIDYKQYGDSQYKYIVSDVELIDVAFAMVVKLKEEGVI